MSGTNPSEATPSGAAWTAPQPSATLGLSSSTVFGTAFSSSLPQSLQLATGSQLKVCVDPVGFSSAFMSQLGLPPWPTTELFLGSGITGNVQVTLGTSANITVGELYNIHLGPKKHDLHNAVDGPHPHAPTFWLGLAMAAVSVGFQIAYGLETKDDHRAHWVLAYQLTMEVLLATLMTLEGVLNLADNAFIEAVWNLHLATSPTMHKTAVGYLSSIGATAGMAAVALAGATVAPILESMGEDNLDKNLTADANIAIAAKKFTGDPGTGEYVPVGQ